MFLEANAQSSTTKSGRVAAVAKREKEEDFSTCLNQWRLFPVAKGEQIRKELILSVWAQIDSNNFYLVTQLPHIQRSIDHF